MKQRQPGKTGTFKEIIVIFEVSGATVLVDDEDAPLLSRYTWKIKPSKRSNGYLSSSTRKNGKSISMYFHRIVLGVTGNEIVDHINGDTLDNRKANLRITTSQGNNRNMKKKIMINKTSRFKGPSLKTGKWEVCIRHSGKQHYLGRYKTEEEAAYVYDMASLEHHGEFGRRNFLPLA